MRVSYAIAFVAALSACAVDQGTEEPSPVDVQADATTAFANDKPAFDYFVGKGLTPFQAAGIVGNLDQESGVNPSSVQADGPGRGIAQWSTGGRWDTSANDNVKAYANAQGESMTSLDLQLQFIWYELTNIGYGYSALKNTTNVTDATVVFQDDYEICGDCVQSTRVQYAKDVLNAYGSIPYSASYVSQSWPLATTAMHVQCGQSVAAKIVLENTGVDTWDSSTKLGTTEPRDRDSIFAGSDWLAPNRAATAGTVAPGHNGTFAFAFHGPTGSACVPGQYKEYFGVVQDGVAWFSDSGNGGPADDQIEALIQLDPADDSGSGSATGSGDSTGSDDGSGSDDSGGDPGSDAGSGTDGAGEDDGSGNGAVSGGCAATDPSGALAGVFIVGLALGRRRRR